MLKKHKGLVLFVIMVLTMLPFFNVKAATSTTVDDQASLKEALKNEDIDTIVLSKDIETTEKINITRSVTLDGNNHQIKYVGQFKGTDDFKTWDGIYVLQVYRVNATIKDIKLTGGNAGLLINGANVKLVGTIDVSGNGFGGIELGKGAGVTSTPEVELSKDTKLKNDSETKENPTLWADETDGVIEVAGVEKKITDGSEITISEYQEMFDIKDNPNTSDKLLWFAVIGLVGFITLGLTLRKLTIKNRN